MMSGTPIYDRLARGDKLNPFKNGRRALVSDDRQLTVPVERPVEDALNRLTEHHFEAAVAALAPFGLHPYDVARPTYERVVYEDEV
jgi:hypothetical protein